MMFVVLAILSMICGVIFGEVDKAVPMAILFVLLELVFKKKE